MSNIGSWHITAANNNAAPPDGWPEGQPPSSVNNCAREMMAQIKTQWNDAAWFNYHPSAAGNVSLVSQNVIAVASLTYGVSNVYVVGRRLKVISNAVTIYGEIATASLTASAAYHVTMTPDSGTLTSTVTSVMASILDPINSAVPGGTTTGTGNLKAINQANAFAGGEWLYLNAGVYTVASNASVITAEVVGRVSFSPAPTGAGFSLLMGGYITGDSGLVAGTVYFLDTAGAQTAVPPTAVGTVVMPLMVADDTTTGVMIKYRGELIVAAALQAYDVAFIAGFSAVMAAEDVAVQNYGQLVMARTGSFTGEAGYADTAPTDADLIVDVLKNGVTIYATLPEFADGANTLTAGVLKTDGTEDFVAGDRITFAVTQIGATNAGQGVRFTVTATSALV